MPFTSEIAASWPVAAWLGALRGGRSTSPAKQRAARRNGRKRKKAHALFSMRSTEWETPAALYQQLDAEFHFTLDVCATPENAKCRRFFTKADDGLSRSWSGERCWMNPPYGRGIGRWIEKAFRESRNGAALVVALVPARTDTSWWHECALKGVIRFLRGRLRFGAAKDPAPFPSAVVIFRPPDEERWREP